MNRHIVALLAIVLATAAAGRAADPPIVIPPVPSADVIATAPSFDPNEPVLATHYFYWYRWPSEHFFNDAGRTQSILRHHFPDDTTVSYESQDWHRQQMQDMLAAGIDVALCVYWGAPNQYEKDDLRFSVHGLPPLVAALDELAKEGRTPRIGLFYDTSTLLGEHAYPQKNHGNVDLRTDEGKDIFYRTIRDFFCLLPPRHWACIDGRPLVQLYESAFAAGHDQSTLDYVYAQFAKDFAGRRPLIIAGPAWSFKADRSTGWGAALGGPLLGRGAVQIGPGYDDSPVPERTTPTRDRLGGGFYAASWLLALQAQPKLIIIETWSELHEGTDICATREDGRYYIDLTRHYSDMFKAGRAPSDADWARVVRTLLSATSGNPAGREFASRLWLTLSVAADGRLVEEGLRLCPAADGAYEHAEVDGMPCIRTKAGVNPTHYLYFDVADPYYYDHRGTLTVKCTYFDAGRDPFTIEYDSADDTGQLRDRYKPLAQPIVRTDTQTWKTATIALPGARAANRQNGGADFRLVPLGSDLAIWRVEVTKLPEDYGH